MTEQQREYIITEEQLAGMIHAFHKGYFSTGIKIAEFVRSRPYTNEREKVLDEYNAELLTKLVQELAGTWRIRDTKLFAIIRKYRRVPIGAMKELRTRGGQE
jgi:hypothetical protein